MPNVRTTRRRNPPAYRLRPGYAQAIVTLTDALTKQRRDYWLGPHGTTASRELYHRVLAAWEANGRRLPDPAGFDAQPTAPTSPTPSTTLVVDVILAYWRWAKGAFDPKHTSGIKGCLRLLRRHYGQTPAAAFGPRKLRVLREAMLALRSRDGSRPAWSRKYINTQVQRLRHVFKWAAAREMVPVSVHQALATLEPLRRGRTTARETERVRPVDDAVLDAVRPHLNAVVAAVVELQLLTGARPAELLGMRPVDIDFDAGPSVWAYQPAAHKNAFRERERIIYFGPKAQAILRSFLAGRATTAFLFSPAEAEAARRAALHDARETPLHRGNRPGTHRRRTPRRTPGDRYNAASYYRSIQYACEQAFPPPPPLGQRPDETRQQWRARVTPAQREELQAWRAAHHFHPYQLRHRAATDLRRACGLEGAQLALGHSSAHITDAVYAERDRTKVIQVMRQIG